MRENIVEYYVIKVYFFVLYRKLWVRYILYKYIYVLFRFYVRIILVLVKSLSKIFRIKDLFWYLGLIIKFEVD